MTPPDADDRVGSGPDVLDRSAEIAELHRAAAERNVRDAAQPERHPNFDGMHCVEDHCGVEIPLPRLALGKIRCVDCQACIERRRG